jgi:hypothetical protein
MGIQEESLGWVGEFNGSAAMAVCIVMKVNLNILHRAQYLIN